MPDEAQPKATPAAGSAGADDPRWAALRAQIPVLRDYAYLNCGWSGPLSLPVHDAIRDYLALELAGGPTTRHVLEARLAAGDRFRAAMARLLNATPEEIAITGNTTEGLNIVLNGLHFAPGNALVTTSVEHGSGLVPSYFLRERRGVELRFVPCTADDEPAALLARFERALRGARLLLLSEISYSTGQRFPLAELVALAHAQGAEVLVDGAQTAGHIPIDVRASDVDYYALPSHKWLCGPDGLGALYVRRDRIPGVEPAKVGGRAAVSYEHDGSGFEPEREAITKFEVSTVSGALLAGAAVAVEQYLALDPQAVWQRVLALNRYAEGRFADIPGVEVRSPRDDAARSGLFLFSLEGEEPARVSAYLQLEGRVICRAVRELGAVRLSLHAYTTEAEIDQAAETLKRAVREGIPADLEPVTPWERLAAEQT